MTLSEDDRKELQDWLRIQFRVFLPSDAHVLPADPTLYLKNPVFKKSPIRIKQASFTPGIAWDEEANISVSILKDAISAYVKMAIDTLVKTCKEETDKKKEPCQLVCTEPDLVYEIKNKRNLLYLTSKCAFVGKSQYEMPELRKQNESPADFIRTSKIN